MLTSRGWRVIAIAYIFLIASAVFSDSILSACSLVLVALLIFSFIDLMRKVSRARKAIVEPSSLDLKLVAGNEDKAFLRFHTDSPFELDSDKGWLGFQPRVVRAPNTIVEVLVKPTLSGVYEISSLRARVYGFFSLSHAWLELPVQLRLVVYPRVYPWVLEALSLLGEARAGTGDIPGKRRGRGLEYLWSREYQVGDEISFIDWKATARHQKIIVKEFLEDTYGSAGIIYDVRAHGPVTKDECCAYFLSAVVSASRAGLPISIMIKNGDEVIVDRGVLNPAEALKLALSHVVEEYLVRKWNVYELFEPKATRVLLKISEEVSSKAFKRIAELRLSDFLRRLNKVLKEGRGLIVYVGCVLIDSGFVKDLVAEVSSLGGRVVVLSPLKPWLDASSLEEAYLMFQSNDKLFRALESMKASLALKSFSLF